MNRASIRRIAHAGLLSLGVAALGACGAESPTTPQVERPSFGFFPNGVGPSLAPNSNVPIEAFKVCKEYVGTVGPAVQILVEIDQGNDGSIQHSIPITVANGECWMLWEASGGVTDRVTVTETVPGGYTASHVIQTVVNQTLPALPPSAPVASNIASATLVNRGVGQVTGVKVTFTNTEIPSGNGCTLTQGYWKTHSASGPAPFDDGWLEIGALGAGETFFTSGMTWLQIFNTPPSGGNAYLQLAHQYMAAKLNILNGTSSTTAVDAAIAGAEAYFAGKAAGVITETNAATKTQLKGWAATLASYNEGGIGPGHCSAN